MTGPEQKKLQKHIKDTKEPTESNTPKKKDFSQIVQESQIKVKSNLEKQCNFLKAQSEQSTLSSLEKNRNSQAAYELLYQINNTLISAERYSPKPDKGTIKNTENMAQEILKAYPDIIHKVVQEKVLSKIKPIAEFTAINMSLGTLDQEKYSIAAKSAECIYNTSYYSTRIDTHNLAEAREKLNEGIQKLYDHSKVENISKEEIVEAIQNIHNAFDHANTEESCIKQITDLIRTNPTLRQYLV